MPSRHLLAEIAVAAAILAALAFFAGLLLAAQTVGVEAWHDSAVPAGAFVAIRSAAPMDAREGTAPALHQPRTSAGGRRAPVQEKPAPSPSLRAVPRLAARRSAGTPQRGQDSRPTGSMTGTASWFASPANVSAAGPALRAALGSGWRGTVVTVTANGVSVRTQLGDWCQCYGSRLIDLDRPDFARLGDPSLGLLNVEVSW